MIRASLIPQMCKLTWLIVVVSVVCICACVVCGQVEPGVDAQAIWERVVEANKAWLQPEMRDISYSIELETMQEENLGQRVDIWYRNPEQLRMHIQQPEREGQIIYTDGIMAMMDSGEERHYRYCSFNEAVLPITDTNVGCSIRCPVLFAAKEHEIPNSLHVVGLRAIKDRNTILLEAPEFRGFGDVGTDPLVSRAALHYDFEGARWYVDPQTFALFRAEAIVPENVHFGVNESRDAVWEFPDGYFETPRGYAPKSIVFDGRRWRNDIRLEYTFQLLEGETWFTKEVKGYLNGELNEQSKLKQVSLDPIDPQIFDLAAAGFNIADPTQGTGGISGKVVNTDTGQPVSGASVKLLCLSDQIRRSNWGEVVSETDGAFQFTKLPDLQYYAVAEKKGLVATGNRAFHLSDLSSEIRPDQAIEYAKLENGEIITGIELALADPREVMGRVVCADTGKSFENAEVICISPNKSGMIDQESEWRKTAITDENGAFRFEGLSAIEYLFTARAEGFYRPYSMDYSSIPAGEEKPLAKTVDLSLRRRVDNIVLGLYTGGTIQGRVLDPSGEPVPEALVGCHMETVKCGPDGAYKLSNLPTTGLQGREKGHHLVAIASGFFRTEIGPIYLTSGVPVTQDIVLNIGGKISGKVTSATGEALRGVRIIFADSRNITASRPMCNLMVPEPSEKVLETDDRGEFLSELLIPASYIVFAGTDGYQPQAREHVNVVNGKSTRIDIQMPAIRPIAGVVLGPTATPLAGITIQIEKAEEPDP
ncbi:MAG: carboxypeptidase-like regulatory domain-containing protein, partial [bacterium]